MSHSNVFRPTTVAVLGAGVMGAQISAHLAQANLQVILFDIQNPKNPKQSLAQAALKQLPKLKPNPVADHAQFQTIVPADYETGLPLLKQCDLIIEAVSESMPIKSSVYEKIAPFINPSAVFASNTSGLSINQLAELLPEPLRANFCGIHFFNPPRYMPLVELIPHQQTNPECLTQLEAFVVDTLGKQVVVAKDTPNFIANRVGVFALLSVLKHAEQFELPPALVDALTGPKLGRPKSASFRTLDVVGLDTFAHVVNTLATELTSDPFKAYYQLPDWLTGLIAEKRLGQKTKGGVYVKEGKVIKGFNPKSGQYEAASAEISPAVLSALKTESPIVALAQSECPQAKFLTAIHLDLWHYCAFHAQAIANTLGDIDWAMRAGFGWQKGPFELWQHNGWQSISQLLDKHIANSGVKAPLPDWISQCEVPHQGSKSFSPSQGALVGRQPLAVYESQLDRPVLDGQSVTAFNPKAEFKTVMETAAVVVKDIGDQVLAIAFKSQKNCVGDDVLNGLIEAITLAEKDYQAVVIHPNHGPDFSVGANLKKVIAAIEQQAFGELDKGVRLFQTASMRIRYAKVPIVAAINGLALGGGCEILLHCHGRVATQDSFIGLVETGVGLIPAAGGCAYLMRQAQALSASPLESAKRLENYFGQIAQAKVSSSACEAKSFGYLAQDDKIVQQASTRLFAAKAQALALAVQFRALPKRPIPVGGQTLRGNGLTLIENMQQGGFISEHDAHVATKLLNVMSGHSLPTGTLVDEQTILDWEHEAFLSLLQHPLTQARIAHTLNTGKPLRN